MSDPLDASIRSADADADANAGDADALAGLAEAEAPGIAKDGTATPLCDGRDRMELAYGTFAGGSVGPEQAFAERNGFGFAIDGHCVFYAASPSVMRHGATSWILGDVHTGVVDSVTLEALATELHYSELGRIGAAVDWACWAPTVTTLYDEGSNALTDGSRTINCLGSCRNNDGTPVLPEGTAVIEAAAGWVNKLYAMGTPMTGPVRVMVVRSPSSPYFEGTPAQWPLSSPIDDFVFVPDQPPYKYYVDYLVEGADADALRALRVRQVTKPFSPWWKGLGPELPVVETSGGPLYSLAVADALPYEADAIGGLYERLQIWNDAFPPQP